MSTATALADNVVRLDGREGKGWESYLSMDSRRKFGRETWQILTRYRSWTCFHGNHLIEKIWEASTMNLGKKEFDFCGQVNGHCGKLLE